jgi:Domain of unknown function (DUF6457)
MTTSDDTTPDATTADGDALSADARAIAAWVEAVTQELGLSDVDGAALVDTVLDLTSDVAHHVSRPGAPVTAFLVGLAAGRASDPSVATRDHADAVGRLAGTWEA